MSVIIEMRKLYEQADKRLGELFELLSKYDLEQQDLLHRLEKPCDAIAMMSVVKSLKEIRSKRREVKKELTMLRVEIDSMKNQGIYNRLLNSKVGKYSGDYKYRTSIVKDLGL